MPFVSLKQRRYLDKNKPEVARLISDNDGRRLGGGFTKEQLKDPNLKKRQAADKAKLNGRFA